MHPLDLLAVGLYGASAGAAALAAVLVALRRPYAKAYGAMAACFGVLALNAAANTLDLVAPDRPAWLEFAPVVLLASIVPLMSLAVEDLVSDKPLVWRRRDLLPFTLAACLGLCVVSAAIFPADPRSGSVVGLLVFVGVCAVLVQATVSLGLIMWRVARLGPRLRRVFASTERRELAWLQLVAVLVATNWAMTVAYNLGLWQGSDLAFSLIGLTTIILMASFWVRQSPVFQVDELFPGRVEVPDDGSGRDANVDDRGKYERSLLDEERLARIARKIEAAFRGDRLYLEPDLSLRKLSTRLAVSENHLSQTFTRRLDMSFYHYVNRWRVEEAKRLLLTTDANVLNIAHDVGFNSRSAFYNAFRTVTGESPVTFRKRADVGGERDGSGAAIDRDRIGTRR
ncbi:MAG: helix-turn-helix domain-containing protein [Rhodospirillales bacterium]|jgi:AraC-like DNA-binding protein